MRATVQRIKDVRSVPQAEELEIVEVLNRIVVVKAGAYQVGDLCIAVETPNSQEKYYPVGVRVMPISEIEGPEEMKVGLSQQPWGDQLQLGPYDNALVIEEGTDVTHLIPKS